jgi:hypothetical protein
MSSEKRRSSTYEGMLTSGYPSAGTENSVPASIVAAGYGK